MDYGIKIKELAENANSEERLQQRLAVCLKLRTGHVLRLQGSHMLQTVSTIKKTIKKIGLE